MMCSGNSLHVDIGMLCLSGWIMMLMMTVFVVCIFVGGWMSKEAASLSVVNCVLYYYFGL